MSRKYRSARGKNVDLSQVLHDNENVRAVGNMNVNARGDIIDSNNNSVQSRNDRVNNAYRKQHKKQVSDDSVPVSSAKSKPVTKPVVEVTEPAEVVEVVKAPEPVEVVETPQPKAEPVEETNTQQKSPQGGLAAAIAKARESKQEVMKTDRQQARESTGVKRI